MGRIIEVHIYVALAFHNNCVFYPLDVHLGVGVVLKNMSVDVGGKYPLMLVAITIQQNCVVNYAPGIQFYECMVSIMRHYSSLTPGEPYIYIYILRYKCT